MLWLKELILPAVELLLKLFFGRASQPPDVSKDTYAAKAAEAKELAKPDAAWPDVTDKL